MTTPLKKALRLAHAALVIGVLAHSNIVSAQTPIAFGNTKTVEFTDVGQAHQYDVGQAHQYTVTTTAGDRLLIHVTSPGVTLSTYVRLFDSRDNQVSWWGPSRSHDRESPALSASDKYRIEVKNSRGIGEYTISVGRIDREGNQILPGSGGSP